MAEQNSGMGFGRLLLYATVICIGGVLLYNFYKNKVADYTFIPEELQINYVPSDFEFDMSDDNVLAILNNPHRYRREFGEFVYEYNMSLLGHIANRMDLADSIRIELEPEYQKHHPYLEQLYFNDFVEIRDTSGAFYEAWYENEGSSAVTAINEVASKYSCFLVNHVVSSLLKIDQGIIGAKGKKIDTPCGIAMTEGLQPLVKRLQERAAIDDFSRSKGMLRERIEKSIAELGTIEIRDRKGLNKQLQTKVWGFSVSSTDIEVSAISILKVGFDLNDFFDLQLDSKRRRLLVTLPEPSILSHEVYPKIDKLDIGWLREVGTNDFNTNFNILRREFRRDANNVEVMQKAKTQAIEIMNMIFSPLLNSINKGYALKVQFKNLNPIPNTLPNPEKRINENDIPK